MKLMRFWNFKENAEKLERRNEILKQIGKVEASLDEQLPCRKQYNEVPHDVNVFMQKQKCSCTSETIDGIFQCQYGCSCDYYKKTCSIDCACEGICVPNTFLHLPKVDVRLGISGDELHCNEDVDSGRLAFVFTGKMTSLKRYLKSVKGKQPDLYAITGRWQGQELFGIGKTDVPTFVINTFHEVAGFVNHSCDPNTKVHEIWQNKKLYVVGKTTKYCFNGDTLSYDYNWIYGDDANYAELCLCGSNNCRAFIAKASTTLMRRSIPRYAAMLNEMETHNIYESQRLDRLMMALHSNQPLTNEEKEEAKNLKQDSEELRLTKRKAVYLRKALKIAKAKLAWIESEEKYKHLVEAEFSHIQRLPLDSDDERESTNKSRIQIVPNSNEVDTMSVAPRPKSTAGSSSGNKFRDETSAWLNNPRDDFESRITQTLNNDGVPLSVRIPFPLKDNDQCVLLGVQDIDKLLSQAKILSSSSKSPCSFLQKPECANPCHSLLSSPPHSQASLKASTSPKNIKNDQDSSNVPYLNQYDWAMKSSCLNDMVENLKEIEPIENVVGILKETKCTENNTTFDATNLEGEIKGVEDKTKNVEDWGEGLFTKDEIRRISNWIDGTFHTQGESSKIKPWPAAKEWAFWLHKNFRHPTPNELENHGKTWVGMSTKTLRACDSGRIVGAKTIPLVRDVNTLLSDVLTFTPFKFSGSKLVESKKSGNIWRIAWNKSYEPLPGDPTSQTCG